MFSHSFLAELENPPKVYRPIPFWSWNEKLSCDETRRQIAEMDKVGIGGYFMHARGGLQTEYMGEEWMANIEAGVDEGRKRGMGAWAYDENGWPSGFGDGKVNGKGEVFQQKYLRYEVVEKAGKGDRHIGCVTLADGRTLRFYFDVNPFYVDTLDAAVVKDFLDEIYLPYAKQFGDDFGKAMPGFFTDEPQVSRNGIPWSLTLPAKYAEAYGEELLPLLPGLFLEVGNFKQTRYRFWKLVRDLFTDNFSRQIFDWCEEHGCQLTGHMVLEETLHSQITSNGAVMPHYEFFHIPGMDWLGRHINPCSTPVQVASVSHQMGKRQILSETFALTGWNVQFNELKWMFEWQMVRGVTQLCQHLEGYSLRGIRKRDYPASFFVHQPWWERYRQFNDSMSRLGMLLAKGDPKFEVMVLHPQTSAWLQFDNAGNDGLGKRNNEFFALMTALEEAQIPYHLGDERLLERHGSVNDATLVLGTQAYRAVLVPPVETIAAETLALLKQFAANGGLLLWSGEQPSLVDGAESADLQACLPTLGKVAGDPQAMIAALPESLRPLQVTDANGAALPSLAATTRHFVDENLTFVFLANSDAEKELDSRITLNGGSLARLVPETGKIEEIPFTRSGDTLLVEHRFTGGGSLALFVSDDPNRFASATPLPATTPLPAETLQGKWDVELLAPNSLTLDYCDIYFDGEKIAENDHISIVQPRALALERPVDIELHFQVYTIPGFTPPADAALVVETPDAFEITVNGTTLENHDLGAYRDHAFRKIDLEGKLQAGENEIVLKTNFRQSEEIYEQLRRAKVFEAEKNKLTYDSEIEVIYLIGSFGVQTPGTFSELPRKATRYQGEFLLAPLPETVQIGDLTPQGLPFYNGQIRLSKTIDIDNPANRSLQLADKMAHIVNISVNGTPLAEWFYAPYSVNLPESLLAESNRIEILLTSGLRNLLGPHHLEEGESYAVAPGCFFKEPNIWGNRPWNDDYCFVQFGVVP